MKQDGVCSHGVPVENRCLLCEEGPSSRQDRIPATIGDFGASDTGAANSAPPVKTEEQYPFSVHNLQACENASRAAEARVLGNVSCHDPALWDAVRMLQRWGNYMARQGSVSLPYSQGEAGDDCESARQAAYVESVMWFYGTRRILSHLYVDARPLSSYRFRRPGEEWPRAVIAHGLDARWTSMSDRPTFNPTHVVHGRFVMELANELMSDPYVPLPIIPKPDPIELVTPKERTQWEEARGIRR